MNQRGFPLAHHFEEFLAEGRSAQNVEEEVDGVIEDEKRTRTHVYLGKGGEKGGRR